MKSRLSKTLVAVFAVLAIAFAAVGCDKGGQPNTPDPQPTEYTVTYSAGEGEGTAPDGGKYVEGATFELPSADGLTKEGHSFDKWNDGAADYAAGATYTMPAKNVTFTATWKADEGGEPIIPPTPVTTYTVTFDPNNEGATWSETVNEGAKVGKPATDPENANGKAFWYWEDSETETEYDFNAEVNGDVTLTAVYAYEVKYDLAGGTGSVDTAHLKVWKPFYLPTAAGLQNGTKIFVGWNDGSVTYAAGELYNSTAGNKSFTAVWEEPVEGYTVSYGTQFYAEGTDPTEEVKQAGDTVTLPQNPYTAKSEYSDYEFKGWYVSGESNTVLYQPGASYAMPAKDVKFMAKWERGVTSYTVTYRAGEHATGSDITVSCKPGARISLQNCSFAIDNFYQFAGWSVAGDSEGHYPGDLYTVNANTVFVSTVLHCYNNSDNDYTSVIYLSFDNSAESYFVIFGEAEDGSQDEYPECDYTLDGENITITLDGSAYNGTFINNVLSITLQYGGASYSFGASAPIETTAPSVTFSANGGTGAAPSCTIEYNDASGLYKIVLPQNTFTAPAGKTFKCWSIGGNEYGAGKSYMADPGVEINVSAVWQDSAVEPEPTDAITFEGRFEIGKGMDAKTTYIKFEVEIEKLKITYYTSDGKSATATMEDNSDSSWKPNDYGSDALYYYATMFNNAGHYFVIDSGRTKLLLCDNDDNAYPGAEFSVRAEGDNWVAILDTEWEELVANDTKLYFEESFVNGGVTFLGLKFSKNSVDKCLLPIYVSNGVEKIGTTNVQKEQFESPEDGRWLFFSSTSYKITIGKKSDGNYYVVSFSYKNDEDTTERVFNGTTAPSF